MINFLWSFRDGYLRAVFAVCFSMLLLCSAYCLLPSVMLFICWFQSQFCLHPSGFQCFSPYLKLHFAFVSYRRPKIWKLNLRSVKLILKTVENQMNWIFFRLAISVPNCMLHYCSFSGIFASWLSFFLKDRLS